MHPATVASHSSKAQHHHHNKGYHHDDPRPPPYNPYGDLYAQQQQQQGEFYQQQQQQGVPPPYFPATTSTTNHNNHFQPLPPPTNNVIISAAPRTIRLGTLHGLPHHSTTITCTNCQQVVSTRVNHRSSCKTHCWAACLFLFLCWPCICIPYCKNSCQTAEHYCTSCDSYMGNSHNT